MDDLSFVTVVVPVKNEAVNLTFCLQSVREFPDVVVVDSGSTDSTRNIAEKHGATILDFKWNGSFPKKRNWTLRNYNFRTQWVLFLDADERVSPEFRRELSQVLPETPHNGFWLNYHDYFMNRLLKHGVPFRKLALFRLGHGEYEKIDEDSWSKLDMEVHEHPVIEGSVGEIESPVLHHGYKSLHHYIAQHNEYSSWEAARYLQLLGCGPGNWDSLHVRQRRKYRNLGNWWYAPVYFLYSYVLRKGFLDGKEGLAFSLFKAFYFLQVYFKIKERPAVGSKHKGIH